MPCLFFVKSWPKLYMRRGQEETRPGMGKCVFKGGGLSRLAPRPPRRPWAPADRFFLPLRLDRRDLVAGVALVDVDERAQSDSGQLSDPDRADPANFAAGRQTGFWMRYGHIELSLSNNEQRKLGETGR